MNEIKEILKKQMLLLSEQSSKADTTCELINLSFAMAKIVEIMPYEGD